MKNDMYVLAHEMKNPLCVAKGYLEMLNKDNFEDFKEIIKNEIDTSLEILDNYLEFNKICINKEEIDINLLLMSIKSQMDKYLKRNGIFLDIKIKDDEIYLKADYDKLKQVIYNVIKNAYEAQARNIYISYKVYFDKIELFIRNDGLKINNIDKIGNNYSSKILGNGIGTTLSKKIIEMHNGKIEYLNDKEGVCCLITLPLE